MTSIAISKPFQTFQTSNHGPVKKYDSYEDRWKALTSRDPESAESFIYCVTTTGIYCRPNCFARMARQENVIFYDTITQAVEAGYRPCKRCKPNEPFDDTNQRIIKLACLKLENSLTSAPQLKELSKDAGLTLWHFLRLFKRYTGSTPKSYWESYHGKDKIKVQKTAARRKRSVSSVASEKRKVDIKSTAKDPKSSDDTESPTKAPIPSINTFPSLSLHTAKPLTDYSLSHEEDDDIPTLKQRFGKYTASLLQMTAEMDWLQAPEFPGIEKNLSDDPLMALFPELDQQPSKGPALDGVLLVEQLFPELTPSIAEFL